MASVPSHFSPCHEGQIISRTARRPFLPEKRTSAKMGSAMHAWPEARLSIILGTKSVKSVEPAVPISESGFNDRAGFACPLTL